MMDQPTQPTQTPQTPIKEAPKKRRNVLGGALPSNRVFQCSIVLKKLENYVQLVRIARPIITFYMRPQDAQMESFQKLFEWAKTRYGADHVRQKRAPQPQLPQLPEGEDDPSKRPPYVSYVTAKSSGDRDAEEFKVPFSFTTRAGRPVKHTTLGNRLKKIFEMKKSRKPLLHQQRVLEFYDQYHPRRFLYHWGLGSGKTIGALKTVGREKHPFVTVVCTLTLIPYWESNIVQEEQHDSSKPTFF